MQNKTRSLYFEVRDVETCPTIRTITTSTEGAQGNGGGSSSGEALVTVSFGAENPKYRRLCLLSTGEVGLPNIMLLLYSTCKEAPH